MIFMFIVTSQALLKKMNHDQKFSNKTPKFSERVAYGREATDGQFPHQALLNIKTGASYFRCGGAIISSIWILTAGHCVEG